MTGIYKILFFVLILAGSQVTAQISPGELSKSHAHLEGISNCTKCHVLGEKETTSKCLECHKEIKNLITLKKGYHASAEVKDKKCASCHGEHFGREFNPVKLDTSKFSHSLTGYTLVGKHEKTACSACHTTRLIKNRISQKKGNTYLGLGTSCLSCHDDFHQKTLSDDCTSCHNQEKFRTAPLFKHEKTRFPLVGKHKLVDCAKCHKTEIRDGKNFQVFSNIQHAGCASCHVDVHKNKFGNDCTKCHTEESFLTVKGLNTFDHSKTNYPLEGKHLSVECAKCHKGSYTKQVKHQFCGDCHPDFHKNQFLNNGKKPDCSECHSVENFTTSKFTIEKHNLSRFKLEGSHLATPCFQCHKKGENWEFKNIGTQCADCHSNIHQNYIQEKYFQTGGCMNCHNVVSWKEIKFDHTATQFPLDGKHKEIFCGQCHFSKSEGLAVQQFKGLSSACSACHTDIHNKQFDINNRTECSHCHTNNNWKPDKFDHNNSRFKLDGSHNKVDCIKCHEPASGNGLRYKVYKFKDISCASCHL